MFTSPGPLLFQIGPIAVHWYGLLIALGILAAYFFAIKEARRRAIPEKNIDSIVYWIIPFGIIGARLYYVAFNLPYYLNNPIQILFTWNGGLAIHGALIGGFIGYIIATKINRLSFFLYLDVLIPGVILAQGIGRFGNFFNNEAFGRPTDLPWKLFIPEEYRPDGYETIAYFHPTFLYEALWNFAGFFLLVYVQRKFYAKSDTKPGLVFSAYLVWYSIGRFFIESLRLDSLYIGPLRTAQLMSIVLFILGSFGLFFFTKKSNMKVGKSSSFTP